LRAPTHIAPSLDQAGDEVALSPLLLEAVAWAESRFNPNAVSSRGAQGVMQLMPDTAAELGVDPGDPDANVRGGARYLRQMLELFDGDIELALAAYNAGPAAVRRYGGVPPFPETRAYVASVFDYMAAHAQQEQQP
jgi:soluble lytic murein transglycosylase-like protein